MKLIRYQKPEGAKRFGCVEDGQVYELEGDPLESFKVGELVGPVESVRLQAPCQPTKVIAVAINSKSRTHLPTVGPRW